MGFRAGQMAGFMMLDSLPSAAGCSHSARTGDGERFDFFEHHILLRLGSPGDSSCFEVDFASI
jgi:hypothetical protein